MIANSNRSGVAATKPEGTDHRSGKDVRSGHERTSPTVGEGVSVIKPEPRIRAVTKDGRLRTIQNENCLTG